MGERSIYDLPDGLARAVEGQVDAEYGRSLWLKEHRELVADWRKYFQERGLPEERDGVALCHGAVSELVWDISKDARADAKELFSAFEEIGKTFIAPHAAADPKMAINGYNLLWELIYFAYTIGIDKEQNDEELHKKALHYWRSTAGGKAKRKTAPPKWWLIALSQVPC